MTATSTWAATSTTSTTTQPPASAAALPIATGPVQQMLLWLLVVALLRRLGIVPPAADDTQDARFFLSVGSSDAALADLRTQIAAMRPEGLPQYDRIVATLRTTGCVVVV